MNVLFVCKNWDGANGICVKSVAENVSLDHKVYVLCSANNQEKNENNIEYMNISNDILTIMSMSSNKIKSNIGKLLNKVSIVLQYSVWPFSKPFYYIRLKKKCEDIVVDKKIDVIIPVYGPIETIYAAIAAKKKNRNIIVLPYFLDALLGGPKPRLMSEKYKKIRAKKVEAKVAEYSTNIIMMKAAESCYDNSQYREKISFLDLPLLNRNEEICKEKELLPKNRINLVYVGNISRQIRNPEILLKILNKIKNSEINFYFIGNSDCDDIFEQFIKIDSRFHRIDSVPYITAKKYMQEADYLLNIGNSLEYMVPSKIFDYMSFYKPIISTTKINADPSEKYLKKYRKALIINERDDFLENANLVEKFIDRKLNSFSEDEKEKMFSVMYMNTPTAFKDHMERVCRIYENKN